MIAVRLMGSGDIARTATLFQEMQTHYRVACPPRGAVEARLSDLPEGVAILVAADRDDVVGFAAIAAVFPGPGLLAGLYLKELYVAAEARGRGVGSELMRAVARRAVERGFARVDWTADRANSGLIGFYEGFGAAEQREKAFMRLAGDALARLAAAERATA